MVRKTFLLLISILFFQSCGTFFNQPIDIEKARIGENSDANEKLIGLPKPVEPVVVGVYKFRDQTGQYKETNTTSSFSTAVTQGATSILIKALEDSKWFVPIERENLSNLLNERNIIRSTRKEYQRTEQKTNEPQLPPLLYAGVLLEGGIVSYDTNIITGGFGARYFGVGGSTQYRQDRITVYLRAISTSNGKILKSVYTSKTILSQALDASLFKYVKFKRLLEAETGYTKNEPVQLAVTDAIEKAVEILILEGIKDKLWKPLDTDANVNKLLHEYYQEEMIADSTQLYGRELRERRASNAFDASLGTAFIDGDYSGAKAEFMGKIGYKGYLNDYLNLNVNFYKFNLSNEGIFNKGFMSLDANAEVNVLPYDRLTPYVFTGFGGNISDDFKKIDPKFQYGFGLEYLVSNTVGIKLFGEHNLTFTDDLDTIEAGERDDFYWRFGLGINLYFD